MDELSEIVAGILSDDPSSHLEATTKFRKIITKVSLSTEYVIESGVMPRFVEFLKKEDTPKLQYEAASIITNIAEDAPEIVIGLDVVPVLVQLLASPVEEVLGQAIWALSNAAGGSTENRDYVLNCGALIPLCTQLNKDTTEMSILRVGAWTLLNFCRGMPRPPFDQVKPALSTLERLLRLNEEDEEDILEDACSALWYMSYGSDDGTKSVIEAGLVPRLVQLFQHTSPYVLGPVRGIISAILSVDPQQIQCVIDGGTLPILANMLTQVCERTISEACFIITNIAVGTKEQIQSVIDANLVPILVNVAQNAEMDVKVKAIWAIAYVAAGGSRDQVKYMVKQSCLQLLCGFLVCPDQTTIVMCLHALEKVMLAGEVERGKVNCYAKKIKDEKLLATIKNLQNHKDNVINDNAVRIVARFWPSKKR